jgi:hypothetical protein
MKGFETGYEPSPTIARGTRNKKAQETRACRNEKKMIPASISKVKRGV